MRDRFYGVCQNSRDPDPTDTFFSEPQPPRAGELFAYLVIGVGSDGANGLAGLDAAGRQRDLRGKDCIELDATAGPADPVR